AGITTSLRIASSSFSDPRSVAAYLLHGGQTRARGEVSLTKVMGMIKRNLVVAQPDSASAGGAGGGPGVLAERVVVTMPFDPFLSLKALSVYSGLSVRKLRQHLEDPAHPMTCYRVGGKILVRRSEFDTWIAVYRQRGRVDVNRIVGEVLHDAQRL